MIIDDTLFYWIHRLFHIPFFYKLFHKKHHEYNNTVGIAAIYAHPIEYLFGNLLPVVLGPAILSTQSHYATHMIWFFWRNMETIDGHCGCEFTWAPYRVFPMSASSEHHNYHHSHNDGAYGSLFTFWDSVCSTDFSY